MFSGELNWAPGEGGDPPPEDPEPDDPDPLDETLFILGRIP